MEGLKLTDADLVTFVHPSKSAKPLQAVRSQLSTKLFTFDETYDGVLLAYTFELERKKAKILSGLIPHFGVNIKARLLLFSPKPDTIIEGKVVKLRMETIHVVVLGMCSAAITSEDIRQEFVYRIKDGAEMFFSTSHKKHTIKVGSVVRFLVKSFDEEVLHISGSLIPDNTGCMSWLSKYGTEDILDDRSSKRRREKYQNQVGEKDVSGKDHHIHKHRRSK